MAEYIEREAVLSAIWKTSAERDVFFPAIILDAIKSIPAADVRPVVRGRWIERTHKLYDGRYGYSIECTHCHEVFTEVDLTFKPTKRNFCPDCGADMREERY